ncbi:MAG: class I SAM-dependent methyltransferase [Candidatus Woesearchaeota archaeon]
MKKLKLYLGTLFWCLKNPKLVRAKIGDSLGHAYYDSKHPIKRINNKIKRLNIEKKNFLDVTSIDVLKKVVVEYEDRIRENQTEFETHMICALAKKNNPKRILEIGTFHGSTTVNLANNTSDDAKIITIDLRKNVERKNVGKFIKKHALNKKITQKYADDKNFNLKNLGFFDFIYIDGDHSYEGVKKDTVNALEIISKGILVWDDYNPKSHKRTMEGILDGKKKKKPVIKKLYKIKGTKLLVMEL